MKNEQTWECANSKCDETYVSPVTISGYYRPCRCGMKRDWKLKDGPPSKGGAAVQSTRKNKEKD